MEGKNSTQCQNDKRLAKYSNVKEEKKQQKKKQQKKKQRLLTAHVASPK